MIDDHHAYEYGGGDDDDDVDSDCDDDNDSSDEDEDDEYDEYDGDDDDSNKWWSSYDNVPVVVFSPTLDIPEVSGTTITEPVMMILSPAYIDV